ncbi:MAG: DsrE/DsrF/TusD sulfur relay family protein [Candidatus Heimdallarchaeota archaeon]
MDLITIIISDAPYGLERPWNALRLALTLTSAAIKSKVNVFLLGDAVVIAKKGQRLPEGYYNLEKMLTDLIRQGENVRACSTCLKARGLNQDDLVEGVEIGAMIELAKWVTESRSVLSF